MQIGDEISIMHIGSRQIAARSAAHKNRRNVVMKKKSIPSMTPYIAAVWAAFAEAASSAYGGTMEEVNNAVARNVTGLSTGARQAQDEKRNFKHTVRTPANIQHFREVAGRGRGGLGTYSSRMPIREVPY